MLFSLRALNREPAVDVWRSRCLAADLPYQGLLGLVLPFSNRRIMASLSSLEDSRTTGDPMEEEERENKAPREEPMVKKSEGSAAVDEKATEMTRYFCFYVGCFEFKSELARLFVYSSFDHFPSVLYHISHRSVQQRVPLMVVIGRTFFDTSP